MKHETFEATDNVRLRTRIVGSEGLFYTNYYKSYACEICITLLLGMSQKYA